MPMSINWYLVTAATTSETKVMMTFFSDVLFFIYQSESLKIKVIPACNHRKFKWNLKCQCIMHCKRNVSSCFFGWSYNSVVTLHAFVSLQNATPVSIYIYIYNTYQGNLLLEHDHNSRFYFWKCIQWFMEYDWIVVYIKQSNG